MWEVEEACIIGEYLAIPMKMLDYFDKFGLARCCTGRNFFLKNKKSFP
jgi:hypothetical protein